MPNYGQNGTAFFNVALLWFSFLIHGLSGLSQNNCTNFIFVLTVWVVVMGAADTAQEPFGGGVCVFSELCSKGG